MRPTRRTRAFTLIELLIAFALLAAVTFLIYQMLIRGSYTAVAGIWRKTTNDRLQQAAERFRKSLEGASFPSVLTPELNLLDRDEAHWVVLKKGTQVDGPDLGGVDAVDTGTGTYYLLGPGRAGGAGAADDTLILAANNCSPARERMEGLVPANQDGSFQRYFFWLEGARPVQRGGFFEQVMDLKYKVVSGTYAVPGSVDENSTLTVNSDTSIPPQGGTVLVPDVNAVRLRLTDGKGADDMPKVPSEYGVDDPTNPEPSTVEIVIRCVEPDGGKAVLTKVITVQPHTGVRWE